MFRFNKTIIREPTVCASLKLQHWRQLKYFVIELFGGVAECAEELPVPLEWEARILQGELKIIQILSVLLPLLRVWSLSEIFPKFSCCYVP
jgi:hypothetical protein